ncbi:TetR/AcrR family transcriptional regulator [Psychrilyobacter atlanticus]|uniref:TetR/AcrR family transcriptional regulator n=1 Tax=Psychrilyobacter atlanticus TaxID=271091 RepID=UPI0003FD0FFD|nr:TetR/AcrR family transcriptional regulator [Psychrilyobacter atlanticus]
MINMKIGKREHKRVIQKMEIMNGFLDAMEISDLHLIKIEDICKTIGISKVTFFNYFQSKEQVIEYFIKLWQYDLSFKLDIEGLVGSKVIYGIFDHVSGHPAGQQIMNTLMEFFIKVKLYDPVIISDYELYIYNEEAYKKGYRETSLTRLIQKGLREKKLDANKETALINIIISGFYGTSFIQNLGLGSDFKSSYHEFLNHVLNENFR